MSSDPRIDEMMQRNFAAFIQNMQRISAAAERFSRGLESVKGREVATEQLRAFVQKQRLMRLLDMPEHKPGGGARNGP